MSKRQLLTWPDEKLRRISAEVSVIDDSVESILEDMYNTMKSERGAGIAAPQIDELLRIFMIDCKCFGSSSPVPWQKDKNIWVLINPVISHLSDRKIKWVEGCLSVPNMSGEIMRHAQLSVSHKGTDRCDHSFVVGWPLAGAVQHENDHLEGIVYLGRLRGVSASTP